MRNGRVWEGFGSGLFRLNVRLRRYIIECHILEIERCLGDMRVDGHLGTLPIFLSRGPRRGTLPEVLSEGGLRDAGLGQSTCGDCQPGSGPIIIAIYILVAVSYGYNVGNLHMKSCSSILAPDCEAELLVEPFQNHPIHKYSLHASPLHVLHRVTQ